MTRSTIKLNLVLTQVANPHPPQAVPLPPDLRGKDLNEKIRLTADFYLFSSLFSFLSSLKKAPKGAFLFYSHSLRIDTNSERLFAELRAARFSALPRRPLIK